MYTLVCGYFDVISQVSITLVRPVYFAYHSKHVSTYLLTNTSLKKKKMRKKEEEKKRRPRRSGYPHRHIDLRMKRKTIDTGSSRSYDRMYDT